MLRNRHWSLTDPKSEILEAYQAINFRGRLVVDVAQEISAVCALHRSKSPLDGPFGFNQCSINVIEICKWPGRGPSSEPGGT